MNFIEDMYKRTNKFPKEEMFGLTTQLRKASISIALNIAEGSGAGSDVKFNRFLNIALRSSYEVVCGIEIARILRYLNEFESQKLLEGCEELSAMMGGLKRNLKLNNRF